jgi:hypothetical protein
MHAVSKSRAVATYVFFASTLAPLSHAYMIAYGHGTLDGLTRSSSPARYRAHLDPTCCDARSRAGPSASVLSRSPSRRILPGDSSPQFFTPLIPPHSSVQQEARRVPLFRACAVLARARVRVCARPLPVRRPAERPILLARQSAGGSRGGHGAQQVVLVWGRGGV